MKKPTLYLYAQPNHSSKKEKSNNTIQIFLTTVSNSILSFHLLRIKILQNLFTQSKL